MTMTTKMILMMNLSSIVFFSDLEMIGPDGENVHHCDFDDVHIALDCHGDAVLVHNYHDHVHDFYLSVDDRGTNVFDAPIDRFQFLKLAEFRDVRH